MREKITAPIKNRKDSFDPMKEWYSETVTTTPEVGEWSLEDTICNGAGVTRFDLEQAILNCWGITDDLEIFAEKVEDNDELSNIVLGLKNVYEMRFSKCFDIFENLIRNKQI